MSDLNDYNSLHALRVRYYNNQIYTEVGGHILIAVNPY
jgi:myosin heavy subunit